MSSSAVEWAILPSVPTSTQLSTSREVTGSGGAGALSSVLLARALKRSSSESRRSLAQAMGTLSLSGSASSCCAVKMSASTRAWCMRSTRPARRSACLHDSIAAPNSWSSLPVTFELCCSAFATASAAFSTFSRSCCLAVATSEVASGPARGAHAAVKAPTVASASWIVSLVIEDNCTRRGLISSISRHSSCASLISFLNS
mmetsp:Transcript_35977/g.101892  ORF Transcript_35977/g.101892 Transcript_35977/m.101892 type:complete len:201 (+) Transcript_35977:1883-2485(+)